MILSGIEIEKKIGKEIIIEPYDKKQLNPNSYNLRLHNELVVYDDVVLDMKTDNNYSTITIPEEGFVLQPGKLYLGRTVEYTKVDNYIPMIDGRSSIGRLGMFIHITAGLGNVGTSGFWTLEIFVVQPLRIYANVEVCQIFFNTIEGEYNSYLSGKYSANEGIQPSFLYKELV